MEPLTDVIQALATRAANLLAERTPIYEQETKSALVARMLRALGWDCEDPHEVRWESATLSKRRLHTGNRSDSSGR